MGLFGRKKDKAREKELKEARATMKGLERTKSQKVIHSSTVDPSRAITELQPCKDPSPERRFRHF